MEKARRDEISIFEIKINPEDIDISGNIYQNALILSLLSEILKLKAEYLYNQAIRKEETKQVIERAFRRVLQEEGFNDEDIEALLMLDSLKDKLKKPKSVKPERMSYQEFKEMVKDEIQSALHKDTDYNSLALEIAKKIEQGTFKIRSIKDFIGLMFAIYLFNLEVDYRLLV